MFPKHIEFTHELYVQILRVKHKPMLPRLSGLLLSMVMALAFLALVVVVIMPPPPTLAEPPGSSIYSEDSGGPTS